MADTDQNFDVTPADRRRERVRQAILLAAERVFRDEGEDGLSIRRLAEEVDYSPAAIYKYFGSKQELVAELKDAFFATLLAEMEKHEPGDDFKEYLIEGIMLYIKVATSRPHHYSAAFTGMVEEEADPDCEDINKRPGSNRDISFGRLLDMISEGIERGILQKDLDPVLVAKSVWASGHGLVMIVTHLPNFPKEMPVESDIELPEFVRFHCEHVITGFCA